MHRSSVRQSGICLTYVTHRPTDLTGGAAATEGNSWHSSERSRHRAFLGPRNRSDLRTYFKWGHKSLGVEKGLNKGYPKDPLTWLSRKTMNVMWLHVIVTNSIVVFVKNRDLSHDRSQLISSLCNVQGCTYLFRILLWHERSIKLCAPYSLEILPWKKKHSQDKKMSYNINFPQSCEFMWPGSVIFESSE